MRMHSCQTYDQRKRQRSGNYTNSHTYCEPAIDTTVSVPLTVSETVPHPRGDGGNGVSESPWMNIAAMVVANVLSHIILQGRILIDLDNRRMVTFLA